MLFWGNPSWPRASHEHAIVTSGLFGFLAGRMLHVKVTRVTNGLFGVRGGRMLHMSMTRVTHGVWDFLAEAFFT